MIEDHDNCKYGKKSKKSFSLSNHKRRAAPPFFLVILVMLSLYVLHSVLTMYRVESLPQSSKNQPLKLIKKKHVIANQPAKLAKRKQTKIMEEQASQILLKKNIVPRKTEVKPRFQKIDPSVTAPETIEMKKILHKNNKKSRKISTVNDESIAVHVAKALKLDEPKADGAHTNKEARIIMEDNVRKEPLVVDKPVIVNPRLRKQFLFELDENVNHEKDDFECLGWKEVDKCYDILDDAALKSRKVVKTIDCLVSVGPGKAGYCQIRHKITGKVYTTMRRTCRSMSSVRCEDGFEYMNFKIKADKYIQNPIPKNLLPEYQIETPKRGIIIAAHHKARMNAYVTVRVLRNKGCMLPIELWATKDEIVPKDPIILALLNNYNVELRIVGHTGWRGFFVKSYAIFYSNFDEILLLDSDNLPVSDPTYLFETEEYKRTGAIFWPDFWHPNDSIFHVDTRSMVWELFGIPFVNEFEQESGQILINRRRSLKALNIFMYYSANFNIISALNLVWGDKDLFRLAWKKANQPYHFISSPPGIAGRMFPGFFCGIAMVQHDPSGQILFIHRNSVKFSHIMGRGRWFTHVQQFVGPNPLRDYHLKSKNAFNMVCYGRTDLVTGTHLKNFRLRHVELAGFGDLEYSGLVLLEEARALIRDSENANRFMDNKFTSKNVHRKMNWGIV